MTRSDPESTGNDVTVIGRVAALAQIKAWVKDKIITKNDIYDCVKLFKQNINLYQIYHVLKSVSLSVIDSEKCVNC